MINGLLLCPRQAELLEPSAGEEKVTQRKNLEICRGVTDMSVFRDH
jgi:hypothetical protein